MTSGSVGEVSPPGQAAPKPNPFERIVGVLFSPNETFASIARQPDWVIPLMLMLVVSLIAGILMAQRVDFTSAAREAMEEKNIPPDRVESAVKMTAAISRVASYCAPIFSVIGFLVIAGVLLLAFRLFGGEGNFKQAFSVSVYAWMPALLKSIITLAVLLTRESMGAEDLAIAVRSNLGFLVSMKSNPMAFAVLTSLDIFTVWVLILFSIGFAYVARVSKAKSATIVVTLWLVTVLFKLVPAAMRSLRG
jgi:hypothetical protein